MYEAVKAVQDTALGAGWTVTALGGAYFQIICPYGLPGYGPTPSGSYFRIFSLSVLPTAPGSLLKYILYDPRWTGSFPPPAPDEIWVPLGVDGIHTANNLISNLVDWNGTIGSYSTPSGFTLELTASGSGLLGISNEYSVFQGSFWATTALGSQSGSGVVLTSQTLPDNTALTVSIREGPWQYGETTLLLQINGVPATSYSTGLYATDTASIYMAQSDLYTVWASPYALAIWQQFDTPAGNIGAYSNHRCAFISQVWQTSDALAENPVWFYEFGQQRLGLASTQAVSTNGVGTMITSDFYHNEENNSAPNPSWSCYVPRFSEVPDKLASSNGTSVMVDALVGFTRGTNAPPCRIYGWIPDSFVMMEDKPLEDVIEYPAGSGNLYTCWRTGGYLSGRNRPGGSLYLAIH